MARGREPHVTCNEQRSTHKVGKESSEKMKVFGEPRTEPYHLIQLFLGHNDEQNELAEAVAFLASISHARFASNS